MALCEVRIVTASNVNVVLEFRLNDYLNLSLTLVS